MTGENSRTLYLGNLQPDTTEAALTELLSSFGTVETVEFARHGKTGEFQRFAYVRCASRDDAVKIMAAAHGRRFQDRPLWCDWSRPAPERWEAWLDPDSAPGYE